MVAEELEMHVILEETAILDDPVKGAINASAGVEVDIVEKGKDVDYHFMRDIVVADEGQS